MVHKVATTFLALAITAVPTVPAFANNGRHAASIMVSGVVDAVNISGSPATVTIMVGSGSVLAPRAQGSLPDGFVGHEIVAALPSTVRVWNAGRAATTTALAPGERIVASIRIDAPVSPSGEMQVEVIGILPGSGAASDPPPVIPTPPPAPSTPAPSPVAPTETPRPASDPAKPAPKNTASAVGRLFRVVADVNSIDAKADGTGAITVDVTRVRGVGRRLRGLLEGKAWILVDSSTAITGAGGTQLALSGISGDDGLRLSAQLLPPAQWASDANGTPMPTFRAKRIRDLDA